MKLFISYARKDITPVDEIVRALSRANHTIWIDSESLLGGGNWWDDILDNIQECECFVFMMTPNSSSSIYCLAELNYALALNKPILPLVLIPTDKPPRNLDPIQRVEVNGSFNTTLFNKIEKSLSELSKKVKNGKIVVNLDAERPNLPDWRTIPIRDFAVIERLICVSPDTELSNAYWIIDEADFKFRHLPVTETGEIGSRLLGMISLRTMQKIIATGGGNNKVVKQFMNVYDAKSKLYPPTFICIDKDDNLEAALKAFGTRIVRDHGSMRFFYMSAIPLIDEQHNAIGIVSFKDILAGMIDGKIPIPDVTVGEYMRPQPIVTGTVDETVAQIRVKLATGQRDVPVIDKDNRLLSIVPDTALLEHLKQADKTKLGTIMPPIGSLRLQTKDTKLSSMLHEYVDVAKVFFSLAVVSDNKSNTPELLGIIGYQDIFQALLDT